MNITGTIMSGDTAVARMEQGKLMPVLSERMPLYLLRGGDFEHWLTQRAIDQHRTNSRLLKKILRLTDTSDLAAVLHVHAATITDDYWLKLDGEELSWSQVRFSSDAFADLTLTGDYDSLNRAYTAEQLTAPTPELTNIGSYEKCWRIHDGIWCMYKRGTVEERFSELFVSALARQLGFDAAEYEAVGDTVVTPDFTQGQYNYEPAASLVGEDEDYRLNYERLEALRPGLGGQYLDILYMDALCFNMDRHTMNYGILRDRSTGEVLRMAPNFDNNIALISRGYGDPLHSSPMLINLFVELLEDMDLRYEPPQLDVEEVRRLTEEILPEEAIRRGYVDQFVMARYEKLDQLLRREQTQQPGMNMK